MIEEERWVMQGLDPDDPACIKSVTELEKYIDEVGFLPLFRGDIPGFSVEEHTAADGWWTDDPERDPWAWRQILAQRGHVAYGKFFDRKAGFISLEWLPVFANCRRDGYDFDALWDDEKASMRSKKIMDLFAEEFADRELYSFEVKKLAGYGKSGEKNFEGEITNLQMQTYLCVRDFKRKTSKKGEEYGWGIAVYCTPEHIWGRDLVTSCYREDPKISAEKIFLHMKKLYPQAGDRQIRRLLGIRREGEPAERKVVPYPDNLIRALKIEGFTPEFATPDQKAGLEVAIGQLRDKQQRTVVMKYKEHMRNEEIGKALNRAAGTVGTYHSKALGKLKWPGIAAWYLEGYDRAIRSYLEERKIPCPEEVIRDDVSEVSGRDFCLRLGITFKQSDALMKAGIFTVFDLILAMGKPDWYRPIKGIGAKTAADMEKRVDERYISRLPVEQ
jgi:hypothetical protein